MANTMGEGFLPDTNLDWTLFMDGYRDPKTDAAILEKIKDSKLMESMFKDRHNTSGSGERQCGSRKEGGTYATCPVTRDGSGKPVEYFVTCQPVPIKAEDYNLSNVGVKLVDIEELCSKCNGAKPTKGIKAKYFEVCSRCDGTGKETVTHVFDIVGQEYYPNVADFIEEARRMGVSRRLELEDKRQYARLTPRSRLFLLHGKAVIENGSARYNKMSQVELMRMYRAGCPQDRHTLTAATKQNKWLPIGDSTLKPACSCLHWHVIEQGESLHADGFTQRNLKAGAYRGYSIPDKFTPKFSLGIFAVFPLVALHVIDPDGSYKEKTKRAEASTIDVEILPC